MGEIKIVGPGKTRGYPYTVCKNIYVIMHVFEYLGKEIPPQVLLHVPQLDQCPNPPSTAIRLVNGFVGPAPQVYE